MVHRNPITEAIKIKFGWTVGIYAERRGFNYYSLNTVIKGVSKCTRKNTEAYKIKQQLIKDGVWYKEIHVLS